MKGEPGRHWGWLASSDRSQPLLPGRAGPDTSASVTSGNDPNMDNLDDLRGDRSRADGSTERRLGARGLSGAWACPATDGECFIWQASGIVVSPDDDRTRLSPVPRTRPVLRHHDLPAAWPLTQFGQVTMPPRASALCQRADTATSAAATQPGHQASPSCAAPVLGASPAPVGSDPVEGSGWPARTSTSGAAAPAATQPGGERERGAPGSMP
jgi:hypothetical protein